MIHVAAASSSFAEMVPRLHDVKDEFNDDEGECHSPCPTNFKPEKKSFKDEEEMMVEENTREEDLGKTVIEALVDGCRSELEAWKKEICYDEVK